MAIVVSEKNYNVIYEHTLAVKNFRISKTFNVFFKNFLLIIAVSFLFKNTLVLIYFKIECIPVSKREFSASLLQFFSVTWSSEIIFSVVLFFRIFLIK